MADKPKDSEPVRFVASFVHWRSGKRLFAKDYGLKGFPIPIGKKKK